MKIVRQYKFLFILFVLLLVFFYVKPIIEKFQVHHLENEYHDEELERLRAAVSSQLPV